jgi:hypothetical protein
MNSSMFITEVAFWWLFTHTHHYAHVLLVLPYYCCQDTCHPSMYVNSFKFSILLWKSRRIYLQFCMTILQQMIAFVCRSSNKSRERTNRSYHDSKEPGSSWWTHNYLYYISRYLHLEFLEEFNKKTAFPSSYNYTSSNWVLQDRKI